VNADSVRLAIAKKHCDIARALLDFKVVQLRKETEEVRMCVCVCVCACDGGVCEEGEGINASVCMCLCMFVCKG